MTSTTLIYLLLSLVTVLDACIGLLLFRIADYDNLLDECAKGYLNEDYIPPAMQERIRRVQLNNVKAAQDQQGEDFACNWDEQDK